MKHKILIIDDSKEILFAISEFFLLKDWEVYTALSVEEAIRIISSKDLDIIIIDYHMPYINGVLGVKLIRQINATIPIIALTIEGVEKIAEEFFEAGANDFSIKPIKVLDLYSRVQVHIQNSYNQQSREEENKNYKKGFNPNTLLIIQSALQESEDYVSIEDISSLIGLATQTVNKYMNYLLEEKLVQLKIIYGKIGRPKNHYLWSAPNSSS